ncbi:MAG: sigma-70 family RNA polymerase sigma factor, partial [Polyangiaceae bacterium]
LWLYMTSRPSHPNLRAQKMMPVVHRIARRLARRLPRNVELDDLVGAGMVGLADAIDKMRSDPDPDFCAYATRRIQGEMIDELRRQDPLTRPQRALLQTVSRAESGAWQGTGTLPPPATLADAAGVTEDQISAARRLRRLGQTKRVHDLKSILPAPVESPEVTLAYEEQLRVVRRAVGALPHPMKRALACYQHDLTLKQVGAELGVTEGRVCQIRKEAVARLRAAVARDGTTRTCNEGRDHAA